MNILKNKVKQYLKCTEALTVLCHALLLTFPQYIVSSLRDVMFPRSSLHVLHQHSPWYSVGTQIMFIAIETSQFKRLVRSRSWKTYLKTDVLEERTDEVLEGLV